MEILRLQLYTDDINETASFYNSHLGFEIVKHDKSEVSFRAGATTLVFKQSHHLKPIYHFAFNIPPTQLQQAYDWLEDRVEIIDVTPGEKIADFVNWNAKSVYFKDNNGNILELIARYDVDAGAVEPFSAAAILSVSEIGIAIDDMMQHCDRIITDYGIPVFARQPRFDNFTALGDDNGLLIFSSTDRHWYPTDIWARSFPVKVTISNDGMIRTLEFGEG